MTTDRDIARALINAMMITVIRGIEGEELQTAFVNEVEAEAHRLLQGNLDKQHLTILNNGADTIIEEIKSHYNSDGSVDMNKGYDE